MSDDNLLNVESREELKLNESTAKETEVDAEQPLCKSCPVISTYKMRPSLAETFKGSRIKEIIQRVMTEKLQGKLYNANDARNWTREIADEVSMEVKTTVEMPRYKHVVQVTLGQQLGAGCRYIAKCCWDAESDSHTSDVFSNTSLFCICTVFGVYLY